MKSFIAAILLFFALVFVIICNGIYVRGVCDEISDICKSLSTNSSPEIKSEELSDLWKQKKPLIEFSVRISETERMTDLIESLNASVLLKNEAEIKKYCTLISGHAKDIANHERISLSSIF